VGVLRERLEMYEAHPFHMERSDFERRTSTTSTTQARSIVDLAATPQATAFKPKRDHSTRVDTDWIHTQFPVCSTMPELGDIVETQFMLDDVPT
jgi:hypothetical protein